MVELTCERIILRRLVDADRNVIHLLLRDPKVRRYLGGPVSDSRIADAVDAYYFARESERVWAVQITGSYVIGLVSLTPHKDGQDMELSYQFLSQYWGMGYAQEAVFCVLDFAKNELNLDRVIAETQAANRISRRLLEAVGMRRERSLVRFEAEQIIYVT